MVSRHLKTAAVARFLYSISDQFDLSILVDTRVPSRNSAPPFSEPSYAPPEREPLSASKVVLLLPAVSFLRFRVPPDVGLT